MQLDNGNCNSTKQLLYFAGEGPRADGELQGERGRGAEASSAARSPQANARLAAQPLTPQYVYEPAKPLQKLGVVVRQFPAQGTLSSYGKVTLVLPKALQGEVPKVVGLRLGRAKARLERLHLKWKVDGDAAARRRR